ncbi:hypothetical protein [Budvicia aquatica]|uniref:Uncharacterized protein n=1 Tax=Budvicia aquatica TaxID=82979 RepID=A0A2C6DJ02_9GAMM|nr:hypothetical protein [Budvicia aquatica]PHI31196.1 hypothetical protein CRN84_18555 [Budvicia aquatica]VFS51459.1 Uncharacterised protein [Budvicia aquatica]
MRDTTKQPSASVHHVEATKRGIQILKLNPQGLYEEAEVIGFSDAITRLDHGGFDKHLSTGLRILAALKDAEVKNHFIPTVEQQLIGWRWLVSTVFINEQWKANGTVGVENEEGGIDMAIIYSGEYGAMCIYPGPTRTSLAINVEGPAIGKYGTETGMSLSIQFYKEMLDINNGIFQISAMGLEGLTILYDGFIKQIQDNGLPVQPTMH